MRFDAHTTDALKKSIASSAVKGAGALVGMLLSILIARMLGAAGTGTITLANKLLVIVVLVAAYGMRSMLIKDIAIARRAKDSRAMASAFMNGYVVSALASFLISCALILAAPWMVINLFDDPDLLSPLLIGLVTLPTQALTQLYFAGMVALKHNWQATAVEQLVNMVVTTLALAGWYLTGWPVTVDLVAWCYALGRVVAFLAGYLYWHRLFSERPLVRLRILPTVKVATPFMVVSVSASVANGMDVLVLGVLSDSAELGIYAVVARLALLSSFFLAVVGAAVSPKISAFYAAGEIMKLEAMLRNVTLVLTLLGAASFLLYLTVGQSLLEVWGPEFAEGYLPLLILSLGQFINLATGCAGTVLVMTGNEKNLLKLNFYFILLNVALLAVLSAVWGGVGAAIAMALSVSAFNVWKWLEVKKQTGIAMLPKVSFPKKWRS